jgi:biopolymer transport protein TolR
MVSAPLLTVGVPLDLPQTQAKSLEQDKTPLQLSVDVKGKVFINDTEVAIPDLVPKLKAITDARGGMDERIFMRADKKADYGTVAKVMGLLSGAGFKHLALVTEVEQGQ